MKKWIAILLAMMVFLSVFALAETNNDDLAFQNAVNFETFCAERGVPYEGEWICFDEALYLYFPSAFEEMEIAEEMRSAGVLAEYRHTDAEHITTDLQISKEETNVSAGDVLEAMQAYCVVSGLVKVNEIPVVLGYEGTTVYVVSLIPDANAYLVKVSFSCAADAIGETQVMFLYGIVCSLSETPLEIGAGSAGD